MVKFDDKDFQRRISDYLEKALFAKDRALSNIASEILRLSQREVPHDTGQLQNSGNVDDSNKEDVIVGYHTPYAAKLHEHPEYRFQKGRKGKYLEDPIKHNIRVFRKYYEDIISGR